MSAQSNPLEENLELAAASDFLLKKLKIAKEEDVRRRIRVEYLMIQNLAVINLAIGMSIRLREDGLYSEARDFLGRYLERLSSMANKYPIVEAVLKGYTERLGELSKKNQILQELYESYKKAFGGKRIKCHKI